MSTDLGIEQEPDHLPPPSGEKAPNRRGENSVVPVGGIPQRHSSAKVSPPSTSPVMIVLHSRHDFKFQSPGASSEFGRRRGRPGWHDLSPNGSAGSGALVAWVTTRPAPRTPRETRRVKWTRLWPGDATRRWGGAHGNPRATAVPRKGATYRSISTNSSVDEIATPIRGP